MSDRLDMVDHKEVFVERLKLIGVNVDSISEEEVYERILRLSEMGKPAQIVLLDTALLIKARLNKELLNCINSSDLVLPVSAGVRNGLRFFNHKVHIFNYFYFTIRLLSFFTDHKKIVYMLGGSKKIIDKAEKNVKQSFPGIKLMGKYHTQYKKDFEPKLITAIRKIEPALVVVSMKRPKQEKWIAAKKAKLNQGVFLGVENFVDILGGKLLSPSDRIVHSTLASCKKIFKKPLRIFDYILYFNILIVYKLFKIQS